MFFSEIKTIVSLLGHISLFVLLSHLPLNKYPNKTICMSARISLLSNTVRGIN